MDIDRGTKPGLSKGAKHANYSFKGRAERYKSPKEEARAEIKRYKKKLENLSSTKDRKFFRKAIEYHQQILDQ